MGEKTGWGGPSVCVLSQTETRCTDMPDRWVASCGTLKRKLNVTIVLQVKQRAQCTRSTCLLHQNLRRPIRLLHVQGRCWRRRPRTHITSRGFDGECIARRAGKDAEGQCAAIRGIAHEEVCLVAGQVPGLGGKAGSAVLLQAGGGCGVQLNKMTCDKKRK